MELDRIYKRLDRIGDKLSNLELLHEWTPEQKSQYEALENEYKVLESINAAIKIPTATN